MRSCRSLLLLSLAAALGACATAGPLGPEGIARLEHSRADNPKSASANRSLGIAYYQAKEYPQARQALQEAAAIDPGAIAAAGRHQLPLRRVRPRHIDDVYQDGDLVVTVCDLAREELGGLAAVHWSVPDPVPSGDPGSFDAALDDLGQRVGRLALRLVPPPRPQAPASRGA